MPGVSWCQVSPAICVGLIDGTPTSDISMPADGGKHVSLALMLEGSGHYQMGGASGLCPYEQGCCYLSCAWERFTGTDFFPACRSLKVAILQYRLEWLDLFKPLLHDAHEGCTLYVHHGRDARILRMSMPAALAQIAQELLAGGVPDQLLHRLKVESRALTALWHVAHYLTCGAGKHKCDLRASGKSVVSGGGLTGRERRRLLAARTYIQEHCLAPIEVEGIARAVGLSHAALKQGFRKLFGKGVYGYVLECRLDHAVKLLDGSDLPVKDIASKCGFAHTSHLARLFRQRHRVTPRVYRCR